MSGLPSPDSEFAAPRMGSAQGGADQYDGRRQACKRCHTRKRKCDGARPKCSQCVQANVECEPAVKPSEHYERLQEELYAVQTRNEELERQLVEIRQHWQSDPEGSAGHKRPRSSRSSRAAPSDVVIPPPVFGLVSTIFGLHGRRDGNPSSARLYQSFPQASLAADALHHDGGWEQRNADWSRVDDIVSRPSGLPELRDTLHVVRSFCDDLKITHQVTTRRQLEADVKSVYDNGGLTDTRRAASRFRLFAVLFISGNDMLGYGSLDTQFVQSCRERAMTELPVVVAKDDLTCVQSLTLLAMMGLYSLDGPSMWQMTGLALRTAVTLGIHRKDSVFLPPYREVMQDDELESFNAYRKNIFWTIYVLDRLCSIVLGRPMFLRDADIDLELPADVSLPGCVSAPAVLRHGVIGRRLHARIIEELYGCSVVQAASFEGGEAVVDRFTTEIQVWYSSNPLRAAFVPMSEITIKRQCVIDIQYQQMMMSLHRPSTLIPQISSNYVSILQEAAKTSLQLLEHYCAQNKLILHWANLHLAFATCVTLLYCLNEMRQRPDLIAVPLEAENSIIRRCRDILARFEKWPQCERYRSALDVVIEQTRTPDQSVVENSSDPASYLLSQQPLPPFDPSLASLLALDIGEYRWDPTQLGGGMLGMSGDSGTAPISWGSGEDLSSWFGPQS